MRGATASATLYAVHKCGEASELATKRTPFADQRTDTSRTSGATRRADQAKGRLEARGHLVANASSLDQVRRRLIARQFDDK